MKFKAGDKVRVKDNSGTPFSVGDVKTVNISNTEFLQLNEDENNWWRTDRFELVEDSDAALSQSLTISNFTSSATLTAEQIRDDWIKAVNYVDITASNPNLIYYSYVMNPEDCYCNKAITVSCRVDYKQSFRDAAALLG